MTGTTLTFVIPPSMSEIALIAGEHGGAYGQAYGLFNVAFSGGFMVGPLWGGYVTERAGWGVMVGSLAGLAGVSVIPVAIWTGGWISWRDMRGHFRAAFRRAARRTEHT
jgi:MFS family permease